MSYIFYANFKKKENSYIETPVTIEGEVSEDTLNYELIKWVKSQIDINYRLVSLDSSGNYTFEYTATMGEDKIKGVYSIQSDEGEKGAEENFPSDLRNFLIRDAVEYDKDEAL